MTNRGNVGGTDSFSALQDSQRNLQFALESLVRYIKEHDVMAVADRMGV